MTVLNFAICRDAARHAGLSATAEVLVTFGIALHFFVAGNRRHFKLNMWVEHSKSRPTDDKKIFYMIKSFKK